MTMNDLLYAVRPLRATVDAKIFSEALKSVVPILKKSAIPVLEEVSVRFTGGRCILAATDMTTWIIREIPASGDNFSFVFSRTKKVERACRCFDGSLTIELTENADHKDNGGFVQLSCGSRTAEFDTHSAELCPDVPKVEGDVSFTANAASLLERIGRVAYATLKAELDTRGNKTCVEFSGCQVFALDGYRAAWDNGELNFPQPFLVQAAALHHLKVFGSRQVEFRLSKPWMSVTDGDTTVISHTTDSEPFHLESAVPQKYLEEFSVSPREFLAELNYLKDALPTTHKPYVYLRGNELLMQVHDRKYSTAIEISRTGDTTVGFNLNYLRDALNQFKKEERVTVKISGVHTPIVIEAEGRSDCAMVLPLRVALNAAA